MKLLPIRIGLALGDLVLIRASLLEVEADEEPEMVRNGAPFGFQMASDEATDEVELHLDPEEGRHGTSQARFGRR